VRRKASAVTRAQPYGPSIPLDTDIDKSNPETERVLFLSVFISVHLFFSSENPSA
jgi:hypothetical protein